MSLVKSLTPKNTEEVKPGLFIQKTIHGYRQVHPAAWNGKINWKNFLIGPHFWRNLLVFLIILLLVYGYWSGTKSCMEFEKEPCKYLPNLTNYCIQKQVEWFGSEVIQSGEENSYYIQDSD